MANTNKAMIELGRKVAIAVFCLLGTMLTAFNLLAFKSDKYGVYYQDANQWWFAIGAGMFLLVWLARNWKKL